MATKFDKEMMKKQHFWLLLIPLVIGLILAWIGLFGSVGSATQAKEKENDTAFDAVSKAKAQPKAKLVKYDERKGLLSRLMGKKE